MYRSLILIPVVAMLFSANSMAEEQYVMCGTRKVVEFKSLDRSGQSTVKRTPIDYGDMTRTKVFTVDGAASLAHDMRFANFKPIGNSNFAPEAYVQVKDGSIQPITIYYHASKDDEAYSVSTEESSIDLVKGKALRRGALVRFGDQVFEYYCVLAWSPSLADLKRAME